MNTTSHILPVIGVVMGPTASGKSALALELARSCHGEIVSVDSMQLYRGLAIGTAQPTEEERRKIPHHFVGIADFHTPFDVYRYVALARATILDIAARGKLPILAGGTGLYLRALLYGLDPLPGDEKLRQQLDEEYAGAAGFERLKQRMAQCDPAALAKIGYNHRKLTRALEIRLLTGKSITELQQQKARQSLQYHLAFAFRLEWENAALRERIFTRTRQMLDMGWLEEAQQAIADGLLETPTAHQALGYRLIAAMLRDEFPSSELPDRIGTATWQFARRQMTWFRHQHPEAEALTMPCETGKISDIVKKRLDEAPKRF